MYCIRCGVELEENAEKCPLCETPVPKIENEDMGIYEGEYPFVNINLYELKMKKVKKAVFMSFFTISIISILEVFFQNIIVYGHIGWAYYVIPSILLFDLMLFVILNSHTMRQNLFFILSFLFLSQTKENIRPIKQNANVIGIPLLRLQLNLLSP